MRYRSVIAFKRGFVKFSSNLWAENLSESSIFRVNAECCIEDLADILGCEMSKLPTVYLGFSSGMKKKDKSIWL